VEVAVIVKRAVVVSLPLAGREVIDQVPARPAVAVPADCPIVVSAAPAALSATESRSLGVHATSSAMQQLQGWMRI
jgi:hypothetical protein